MSNVIIYKDESGEGHFYLTTEKAVFNNTPSKLTVSGVFLSYDAENTTETQILSAIGGWINTFNEIFGVDDFRPATAEEVQEFTKNELPPIIVKDTL